MKGSERPCGRHREGAEPGVFMRRAWDLAQRADARRIDQRWPGWSVLYGPGSRRFYAMAAWPAPEPVILQARTAAELETVLHQESAALLVRPQIPTQRGPR